MHHVLTAILQLPSKQRWNPLFIALLPRFHPLPASRSLLTRAFVSLQDTARLRHAIEDFEASHRQAQEAIGGCTLQAQAWPAMQLVGKPPHHI
jgi:hypothetical protein